MKNEIKLEAESQSSYTETEGIENGIYLYQRMRQNHGPGLLHTPVCWRVGWVCFRQ